jgi:hypothetical protein
MSNITFSRIPVITPYFRGDNILYKKKYNYSIGTILHNINLFKKKSDEEKYDAFMGLYLFSIISVHIDIIARPRGLKNAQNLKNKMYIIANTIIHNPIIQKLGIIYLEIKIVKESGMKFDQEKYNEYRNYDHFMNVLDDLLIYLIHIILSYNYKIIKEYIQSPQIYETPKMYETIYPNLIIDLSLILSKIDDNINELFYRFDPDIKFNEFGYEIIPEHSEIFYADKTIVRNFRNYHEIKEIDQSFSSHNQVVLLNKDEPLKHIMNIIENIL